MSPKPPEPVDAELAAELAALLAATAAAVAESAAEVLLADVPPEPELEQAAKPATSANPTAAEPILLNPIENYLSEEN